MSKRISQEYFNSIVKENIDEFLMSPEEALEDAIKQLESQTIDLSAIAKFSIEEQDLLLNSIKQLDTWSSIDDNKQLTNDEETQINQLLTQIKEKFDKDLSFRCLASKNANAYEVFQRFLTKFKLNQTIIIRFFQTFNSYLINQSDILTLEGIKQFIDLVKHYSVYAPHSCLQHLLKCINTSCQLCESNRHWYVENGLCELLLNLFQTHKHEQIEKDGDEIKKNKYIILNLICLIIRSLLLDDDLRVEFGHSHEHAKFIVSQLNGLDVLLDIGLSNEELNEDTLANVMLTLSKLAVRNEYCQEICDKGGLKFVVKCISEEYLQNMALLKSALSLLKSICNNDQVKQEATKSNGVYLISQVLSKYCANAYICELSCASLATILLRNLGACEQLASLNGDLILLQVLNIHSAKPKVTKYCCMAIRNMVSRNKSLGEKLISANVEESLTRVLNQNDPICHEEAKAALRDLELKVELKELWTGNGKQMEY